jgi:hypothetical protein
MYYSINEPGIRHVAVQLLRIDKLVTLALMVARVAFLTRYRAKVLLSCIGCICGLYPVA